MKTDGDDVVDNNNPVALHPCEGWAVLKILMGNNTSVSS